MIAFLFLGAVSLVYATTECAFVAGYWEAWNLHRPDDFGSILKKVNVDAECGESGSNPVIIAFSSYKLTEDSEANPTFGFVNEQTQSNGAIFDALTLKTSIAKLHNKGAEVFISFGGASFSFSGIINNLADVNKFVKGLSDRIDFYDIDGVDFSHVQQDSAYLMTKIIRRLRAKRACLKIMYTIPANGSKYSPWKDVVKAVDNKVDYVQSTIYEYDSIDFTPLADFERLKNLGVKFSQMVYGVMPGATSHADQYTSLTDAFHIGEFVATHHMAGAAIWSINRDTDTRSDPSLADPVFHTGKADGSYAKKIRNGICKHCKDDCDDDEAGC
jgi:chitinase